MYLKMGRGSIDRSRHEQRRDTEIGNKHNNGWSYNLVAAVTATDYLMRALGCCCATAGKPLASAGL